MPKRISRKLLVGLGSIVTFGAVGTVSGFGIKSIIDSSLNNSKLNQLTVNSSDSGRLDELPNYNVATEDMFIKTKNLKRFHFGNTQIGQKITPWGWLGVFDDDNGVKSRIALTGWNGEIIWVNQDYRDKEHNVYDMQYDFNSNMLFVLRTDSTNGFYENGTYPKVWLDVLDATSGKKYKDGISDVQFKKLQEGAKKELIDVTTLLDGYDSNTELKKKAKNLYYLDITYSHNKKAILATWMPNYMQMARQKYGGTQEGSLPSFWDVIKTWDEVATSFMFNTQNLVDGQTYSHKERKFKLTKSTGIEPQLDGQQKEIDALIWETQLDNGTKVKASEIYLLTNPFFTTTEDGNGFVMHLIGANPVNQRVYHKTIGWKIDLTDTAVSDGEIYQYTAATDTVTRRKFDNIEYWTGGGNYFNLKSDKSWTKAKGWNPDFINANLRVNKNMFDENSIVFAYPYSSSADVNSNSTNKPYGDEGYAMPVFNVSQIWLDKSNAQFKKNQQSSKKFHTNYDFGKQIDDYYTENGPRYGQDSTLNSIYPYPTPGSFDEHNVNHSYNRLISVSPFDNTVIYAAKPNLGEPIFSAANSDNKNSWAGFWIANSWAWGTHNGQKYYHPLIIGNDTSIPPSIDRYDANEMSYMLSNINDLYTQGFTFDIRSRMDVTRAATTSLNLYFNQTGDGVNDTYDNRTEGFQSSKIGLLRDFLYDIGSNAVNQLGSKGWADNITPKFRGAWNEEAKGLFATTINKDSFSSIIHSRADLKKWYPRTWANAYYPSNMLKAEEIFSIPNPSTFAVATEFDTKLIGTEFNGKESIDLVSAWKDKGEDNAKYTKRFNRLVMKRPTIQAGLTAEEDGLGLVTKYELPKTLFDLIIGKQVGKQDWRVETNQSHLTLTKVDTVQNTSKQILSAWGDSYKMKKIGSITSELDQTNTLLKEEHPVVQILDKKIDQNIAFGQGNNNNITRSGVPALRLMLRIVKPTGNNLPRWISNLSESFFSKAYPLEPAYQGETTFKDVVKAFADEKARLIDLSEANNVPVGLGNLKIDAYLELNPKFAGYTDKTGKIYTVPGGKAIVDKSKAYENQLIIYKDQFNGNRTIYDQSSINYQDFATGGFGSTTTDSWTTSGSELNGLKNIKVTTDYTNLQDNLVRKQGNNDPLLTFDFKDGTSNLELTPGDSTWFANHFKNYNRLLGLFIKFEYQNAKGQWNELPHTSRVGNNIWTDQEISDNLQQNGNKLLLKNVPEDIKKLRFKLVKNPDTSDPNEIIDIQNFKETDDKYISDEFNISVQRITVDKNWISRATLTNATNSLANLEVADVKKFEESVLANITNPDEKNQVQLVYEFEGNKNLTATQLVQKIQEKFNNFNDPNQGVFALWNGTDGDQLIKAKFVLKNNNNNEFKLVTPNSQNPTDDDLTENVKSTIKSKIDIADYISQLTSSSIEAKVGAQPGEIQANSIKIPPKSAPGRFNGKTFDEINNILKSKGISIKFKQWQQNNTWSDWIELSAITSYAPNKPEIQMGFVFEASKPTNLELDEGTTEITNGKTYTLKLNLPKIVKAPADDTVIKNTYSSNPFTGNTKKLIIEQTKLTTAQQSVLEQLKTASGNSTDYAKLGDVLIFKYQIGDSGFLEAEALKTNLEQQQNDKSSNALKMKVEIKAPANGKDPEFALEESLKTKEFELLEDNNKIIKKWLHGKEFEKELKANNITVTGSKTNLTYNLGSGELTKFSTVNGKYDQQQLTLQYRLLDGNNAPVNKANDGWTDGYLPSSVQSNVNTIELRVASDSSITDDNKIYVYGPEIQNQQTVARIDLSQIATLIKVDPNWFKEISVVNTKTDINALTTQMISDWENKIYQKIPELAIDPNLKNKLVIKYQFIRNEGLEAATLAGAIKIELKNYADPTHHGIVKLYDKTDGDKSGYQIKATFEKRNENDTTIKFVDNTNTSIDGEQNKEKRTGVVDSSNITTTINLTEWIKHLMTSLTVVTTDRPGTIPPNGLVPPQLAGAPGSKLFAGQTFANIETWLKAAKVNFLWRKEESGTDWKQGTSNIKEYDATKKKLWFALDNQSANLKLTLGNSLPNLDWNIRDNKNNPIEIKLDAPAIINISPNKLMEIQSYIRGNTKILNVDTANIEKKLTEFKKSLGSGFENAPLTIKIKVGNEAFYDYKEVATELKKLPDDVANGIVVAQFEIDRSQANGSKFELTISSKAEQQIINDDGTIKVYINDKGIYDDLQATNPKGTSKALELEWQKGISINPTTGVLTTPDPVRGKGLRVEFTFNKQLTGAATESTGSANEINTKWVKEQPKTFRPGVDDKLLIRIRLTDETRYTYDHINKKIEIDLTKIKSIITLDPAWLNQPIAQTEIDINSFDQTHIQAYETAVFDAMTAGGINTTLKDKIEIRYDFNGQENLDKAKLIESIKAYKTTNATQDNLGILQLWNQTSGQKIISKFAVKEKDKPLYELEITGGADKNKHELDTSNIFTIIEFDKVIQWLTTTNKLVEVKGNAQSATFTIPEVNAPSDDTFNQKAWAEVEKVLLLFGITTQYREILDATGTPAETNWKNNLTDIKKYDENIGKIGIRFKFDNQKSKNIKLKTGTNAGETYDGKTTNATLEFKLSLNVKLTLNINKAFVDAFINAKDVIGGNTKYLTIDDGQESAMLQKIKSENEAVNNEFAKAGLTVKYKLDSQSSWKSRQEFINDLQSTDTDQQSNKVLFKFEVTDNQNFIVDGSDRTLFDPQTQPDHDQWKVKFFINDSNWEDNASKIVVTGTTSGLKWTWTPLGVSDEADNKVGNNKIQVEFSAKDTASYDDADASDNAGDLTTGWTRIKPNQIDATTKNLWIRLKAKAGYVYGPAYDKNGQTKTAIAHQVDLKIKREIVVNPTDLLTSLSLIPGKEFVTDITTANLDKFVKDGLGTIQPAELQNHVTVKFNFNNRTGLSSQELYQEIQSIIGNNTTPNYGILQLWNGTVGTKIEAYYDLADPDGEYLLVTANNGDAKAPQEVVTGHIKTKIDLMEIVNDLKTKKIEVESITNKNNRTLVAIKNWVMPNIKAGTAALNGLTWEQFEQRLNDVGVLIEARIVNNPDNNLNDWKPLKELKQYDDTTLQLALRFKIDRQKGSNIVLSVLNNGDVEGDGNNLNSGEFKMNIKAPATVVVDEKLIQAFTSQDSFRGNTKILEIIPNPEQELIQKIVDQNTATNADVFKDLKDRLEVQYYLGKNNPDTITDVEWRSAQELKDFLAQQNTDQNTNKIWFRLNVKDPQNPSDPNAQIFQIDKTAKVLTDEQIDANAKIKIYINETGFTKAIEKLEAVGSTDNFKITGIDDWTKTIPPGLEVGYSNETDPQEHEDAKWIAQPPTTLNTDKKLWVRFKVQDGYEFEGAKKDNPKYSEKQPINTNGIKVIIKLKKEWLEKIKITQNTKDPNIAEEDVINAIKGANVLPTGKDDLVELQYSIKGNDEWVTKDKFIEKLKKLAGSKDQKNFILRREELLVRFNINPKNNGGDYGLNIDSENIDNDNRDRFNVQMVDDGQSRNQNFMGYINLDHLNDFVKDSFHIVGSTSKPKLIIKNYDQMNTLFVPYASENLFDILFTTTKDQNGNWDWTKNQSILDGGKLIGEDGLITQGVTIGADKQFAIKFISKNQKYKVYKGEQEQTSGYVLDLSDNVKITIEITNPFTAAGKTLGIWTRDGSDGKYFQGQGGFKIVVANKQTLEIEQTNIQSAQDFLEKATSIQQNEKDALELVFHYFGQSPSEAEIKRVEAAINDYSDLTTWKSFDSIKDPNDDNWSKNQGYKVGDYVAVALRVKREKATQENPFILKDNDYSMILPIMPDGNGNLKKAGRLAGYKVKTDEIKIEKDGVSISNMVSAELPPLDGWSELQRLNLVQDQLGNYLGVNLKLQVYTTFHEDTTGKILTSGSGLKLVQRKTKTEDPNVDSTGTYKDGQNQDIKDKTGQTVQIWKDKNTKRLSAPKKSTTPTNEKLLTAVGNGVFRLFFTNKDEQNKFSLFRNQDISLMLEANQGEGTTNLPDFYLDQKDKKIEIKDQVSNQIKFIVENEKKITYGWNYDKFLPDQIQYKHPSNSSDKKPEEGFAQIATIYELIKKESQEVKETITADTAAEASKKIEDQLEKDFDGQLKFETTYINKKGTQTQVDGNNIYQFQELNNRDRIMVKIVAKDEDLFYVTNEQPLIINVNGLTQAAPDQSTLQHLRVKQGGLIDGQGSFKILVSDPNNANEDDRQILKGWKFMIRVWDKSTEIDPKTGKRKIKIDWTDDQARIKNLANGDKVEWKLVSEEGNPVKEAYYNTIALQHEQKPDGKIEYKFARVNYKNGDGTYEVVQDGIGDYPEDETKYPEDSGFVISGLKSAVDIFQISKENFAKVMQQLNPTYVGINKQGTIKMEPKYFEDKYWVNSEGELFTKDQPATLKAQDQEETKKEILLTEFLDNVTFYTHDPVLANYQGGFKFSGNDVNNNNHLTNGDKVWATFDMINESDENIIINGNEIISSVTLQLSDVSGLKEVIDPMSPLWYVLMALAGVFTLGTAALIAFLMTRHKKLKGK